MSAVSKGPLVQKRTMTALRIPPEQLEEIKLRAERCRLTFTEYMIRCALGDDPDPRGSERRLDDLEARLRELERVAELGALG